MANIEIKKFGDLKPGDKIYEYNFFGGCSVTEKEIESVSPPNECGYCEIVFKEPSYPSMRRFAPERYIVADSYKGLVIWSTIGTYQHIFSAIFDCGFEYSKRTIREALGIDD